MLPNVGIHVGLSLNGRLDREDVVDLGLQEMERLAGDGVWLRYRVARYTEEK